jgi:hypothetical protein
VLAVAMSQMACEAFSDGARRTFSEGFTCPRDRVEVRARPDLFPSAWLKARRPSREIASDAERLKMWQAEQDKQVAYKDGRYRVFEARGCGQQSLYECARARKSFNTVVLQASCSRLDYLQGMSRW